MNDIILSTQNGEPVASSRDVAKRFGKEHNHVLRDIKALEEGVIIGQRQRSAAAFTGTAIIFRHDFLLLYGSYWYYTPLKEKRKGENLQNSSRIIHLPLYFSIDSRYTNEVSVYKLCLLASTKDFILFIISRGI